MNIDRVRVKGLFDHFDHDLLFSPDERIMIVIGPNGFGKTTTLTLIDTLFNHYSRLRRMPFREVAVSFDDGTTLVARKERGPKCDNGTPSSLTLIRKRGDEEEAYHTRTVEPKDLMIPLSAIEDVIPELTRVRPRTWHNSETGAMLDLEDVLTSFREHFPRDALRVNAAPPEWLQYIQRSVSVRFIDTERLTGTSPLSRTSPRWRPSRPANPTRTVTLYSTQLAQHIRNSIAKYGALSQSLDRTFPARLVGNRGVPGQEVATLREDLDAIERKRSRLEAAGLLAGDQQHIEIPDLVDVDASQLDVLAVYAQDAKQKLGVFDDLYERVSTFTRIANSRFRHKQVQVGADGLTVVMDDDTTLDLEKLSSGEQHELVMLYELLFRAPGSSLILIDEPELSLHVAWQERWVRDLEETAKLSDFRAIVATHSPEPPLFTNDRGAGVT